MKCVLERLLLYTLTAWVWTHSECAAGRSRRQLQIGFPNNHHNIGGAISSILGGFLGQPIQNQNSSQNPNPQQPIPGRQPIVIDPLNILGTVSGFLGHQRQTCEVNNGGCQQVCQFLHGHARCSCKPGFSLSFDRRSCFDNNECRSLFPCQEVCVNTPGSFHCACNNGGTLLSDGRSCGLPQAGESCAIDNGGCAQFCLDKPGGKVTCTCGSGYVVEIDQKSCEDIDECSSNNFICPPGQMCTNTPGSFKCSSPFVEERSCEVNNGGCDHRCKRRKNGRIVCNCRRGFVLQQDRRSCMQSDESCAVNNGGCEHKCKERRRGPVCKCNKGYVLQQDGRSCIQSDESCAVNNGGCEHKCKEKRKGPVCKCNKGYTVKNNKKSCQDIDECAIGSHQCPEICVNTQGSFECVTQPPTNGCAADNGGCQHTCWDTNDGSKCGCRNGFVLQSDGKSCLVPTTTVTPPRACGLNSKNSFFTKIVGGRPSNPTDWPWMAALIRNVDKSQFCGGALITESHVLTAAHCLLPFRNVGEFFVRLGEYDFDSSDDNAPVDFQVGKMKMHESYDRSTQENDIALIKLGKATVFNQFISPICLPPAGDNFERLRAYAAGWGTLDFGGKKSPVLQEVLVPIWNQTDCSTAYPQNTVTDSMMCAGVREGGKDSCQGDSGGPLMVQRFPGQTWYVAGIVSWGIQCAKQNQPGVYTRVNHYLDWIDANTNI